ncbi:MAG: hypothetical protein FJ088_11005, partial [Deltaproteobacteria bacterium]|nr:hypothetical protein [Deltaproteobacteria bacterium]
MKLDKRITLVPEPGEEEAAAGIFSVIESKLTYKNPVYWNARYYRRRCRHIPKEIILFQREEGAISVPRGFYAKLIEIVRAMHPRLRISIADRTVFPRMERGVDFSGTLRDYQAQAIEAAKSAGCGVIQAPTGSGKTVIA